MDEGTHERLNAQGPPLSWGWAFPSQFPRQAAAFRSSCKAKADGYPSCCSPGAPQLSPPPSPPLLPMVHLLTPELFRGQWSPATLLLTG